jgi:hypothetical protein
MRLSNLLLADVSWFFVHQWLSPVAAGVVRALLALLLVFCSGSLGALIRFPVAAVILLGICTNFVITLIHAFVANRSIVALELRVLHLL